MIGKSIASNNEQKQVPILSQSLQTLHQMGPSHIIISSISAAKIGGTENMLQMHASSKISDNQYQTFRIDFPYLKGCFTGTGDTFSALILVWYHKQNNLIVILIFSLNIFNYLLSCSQLVRKLFPSSIKFF